MYVCCDQNRAEEAARDTFKLFIAIYLIIRMQAHAANHTYTT